MLAQLLARRVITRKPAGLGTLTLLSFPAMDPMIPSEGSLSRTEIALQFLEEFHERLADKDPAIADEVNLIANSGPDNIARNSWLAGFRFALVLIEQDLICIDGHPEGDQLN
jgi:hypothetical protein